MCLTLCWVFLLLLVYSFLYLLRRQFGLFLQIFSGYFYWYLVLGMYLLQLSLKDDVTFAICKPAPIDLEGHLQHTVMYIADNQPKR